MALLGLGKKKKSTSAKATEDKGKKSKEETPKKEVKASVPEKKVKAPVAKEQPKQPKQVVKDAGLGKDVSSVLIRPRVTEKATIQAESNVYVFEVDPRATKKDVKNAVSSIYKVNPIKVNIIKMSPRKISSRMRGTSGMKSGYKKAYVHLKEGDRIEIV
jgi:large subunit ribosomal protein L23